MEVLKFIAIVALIVVAIYASVSYIEWRFSVESNSSNPQEVESAPHHTVERIASVPGYGIYRVETDEAVCYVIPGVSMECAWKVMRTEP